MPRPRQDRGRVHRSDKEPLRTAAASSSHLGRRHRGLRLRRTYQVRDLRSDGRLRLRAPVRSARRCAFKGRNSSLSDPVLVARMSEGLLRTARRGSMRTRRWCPIGPQPGAARRGTQRENIETADASCSPGGAEDADVLAIVGRHALHEPTHALDAFLAKGGRCWSASTR